MREATVGPDSGHDPEHLADHALALFPAEAGHDGEARVEGKGDLGRTFL